MSDLNIFLTLTPNDKWGLAVDAFRLPHNDSRYVNPTSSMVDGPSRETTPGEFPDDEIPVNELDFFHRLQLRFDHETKVKGRVIIGSDPERCDVLLAPNVRQYGISGSHCFITFDDQQRPVIRDMSKKGLTVSYDGQAKDERRNHFHWIFFPEYTAITVKLPLRNKQELAFDIHIPRHYKTHRMEYKTKVKRFMAGAPHEYEVAFENLALRSLGTSIAPSESLSPTKRPVYLKRREVGRGTFGLVWKVFNASTGLEYAGKEFFHNKGWEKEIEIMKRLYHVSVHSGDFISLRR